MSSIVINDRKLEVAPLTLGRLRRLTRTGSVQAITAYYRAGIEGTPVTPELEGKYLDAIEEVICLACGVDRDWCEANLTSMTAALLFGAIWSASGLNDREGDGGPEAPSP